MRKILIDARVRAIAEAYKAMVHKHDHYGIENKLVNPEKGLRNLLEKFDKSKVQYATVDHRKEILTAIPADEVMLYQRYLRLLISRYGKDLLTVTPRRMDVMERAFRVALHNRTDLMDKKLKVGSQSPHSFHELIVTALRYGDVRQHIYPGFVRRLGVKSCVYCNANYAVTDMYGRAYYTADHWKPKSRYPYLAISFFNLVPCCFSCNRNKGEDDGEYMCLYEEDADADRDVLHLDVSDAGIALYVLDHDAAHLDIMLTEHSDAYKAMRQHMDDRLHITRLYKEHQDVAEETLWRKMIYDNSNIEALRDTFRDTGFELTDAEVMRYLYGSYPDKDEMHKRPLTRLIQDLMDK